MRRTYKIVIARLSDSLIRSKSCSVPFKIMPKSLNSQRRCACSNPRTSNSSRRIRAMSLSGEPRNVTSMYEWNLYSRIKSSNCSAESQNWMPNSPNWRRSKSWSIRAMVHSKLQHIMKISYKRKMRKSENEIPKSPRRMKSSTIWIKTWL